MVGLYGLMSYSVSRRMREIGIRMAIGADRVNVVKMVLRQGLLLAGIGVAIGILLSALFSRALTAGMGVPSFNLTILALVSLALLGVAMLGAYVPARRASMVDPMRVLRQD
jgi:ABC-type antimicrobial peptide transport system permease subunit